MNALAPILRLFFDSRGKSLLAGMLIASVTALAGVLLLGLSGWFITATAIAGLATASAIAFDVFAPAAGIRFLAIVRTGSRYLERIVTHDATLRILAELRERLFRAWAQPQAASNLLKRPARLLFRLTADIDALDSLYLRVLVPLAAAVVTALIVGFALSFLHPLLGIFVCGVLVAGSMILLWWTAGSAEKPMRKRMKGTEALRARAIDMVAGSTDLIMAGRMSTQAEALKRADAYIGKADTKLNRIESTSGSVFSIMHAALLAISVLVVGLLVRADIIGAPAAAFGVLLTLGALEPFLALRRGAMELSRTIIAAKRVSPQLNQDERLQTAPQPKAEFSAELKDVAVFYEQARQPALRGIDLTITTGERIALIGQSGSGKSTLLSLLAGELSSASGQMRVVPATLLTQRTELFKDTLRGNLQIADANASDGEMLAALNNAGLGAFVQSLPQQLDTMLGEGGLGLSGGQARRLALARLFLTKTSLWLLDEPTESLDEARATDTLACLKQELGNRSLVIATHIKREARLCDRIIVLKQGIIVESVESTARRFDEILSELR